MQKNAKIKKVVSIILIPILFIATFIGGYFSRYIFHDKKTNVAIDILTLMDQVGYVIDSETGQRREITAEDIGDALVNGIFDPYSAYFTEEEYQKFLSEGKGNMSGIGIRMAGDDNEIDGVIFSSPAELAGLMKNDVIVGISVNDGEKISVANKTQFKSVMETTTVGDVVKLNIIRNFSELEISVQVKNYKASYAKYYDSEKTFGFRENSSGVLEEYTLEQGLTEIALDNDTAYVVYSEFNGGSASQLEKALNFMKQRGKTKLILDLRDNTGGYVSELVKVASMLVYNNGKDKTLVAYVDSANKDYGYYTSSNKFNENLTSISVIANQNSASASECLIGAMLYYGDRFSQDKLVIERNLSGVAKTYGKGIMQSTYELITGGALKITTARILWPDEQTCIHGVGIYTSQANSVYSEQALSRAIEVLG